MFVLLLSLFVLFNAVNAFHMPASHRALSQVRQQSTELNFMHQQAAADGDFEKVVDHLSKNPSDISDFDIDGNTMLIEAIRYAHFDMAKYLVDQGPEFINFKNIRYRTALYFACAYAGEDEETTDAYVDIALWMVSKGADYNIKTKDEITPLEWAKKWDQKKKTVGFKDALIAAADGVTPTPLAIGAKRVYWG